LQLDVVPCRLVKADHIIEKSWATIWSRCWPSYANLGFSRD